MPKHIKDNEAHKFIEINNSDSAVRTVEYANYSHKQQLFTTPEIKKTTITTSETKVTTLDNSGNFFLTHKTVGATLYIGDEDVTTSTGFPLNAGEVLEFENMQKNNNNEIYAIGSTSIDLFCVGVYK